MDIQRIWNALTTGERLVLAATGIVAVLLVLAGAVLVAGTPFDPAQTDVRGGEVVDTDGDGLSDAEELLLYGTDPQVEDTSGDGIPDGWAAEHMRVNPETGLPSPDPARETAHEDPVNSGLTNIEEYRLGTDPWRQDTSGDGFHDGWLNASGLDPTEAHDPSVSCSPDGMTLQEKWENDLEACSEDSDQDGLTDREEIDGQATIGTRSRSFQPTDPSRASTGGSGLPDGFAVYHGLDPHDPNVGRVDHSGDGMTAAEEARWSVDRFDDVRTAIVEGLDLTDPDSSDNGIPDAWAIRHGLDPLDPDIADEDPSDSGLTNLEEYQWGTDPNKADTSGNGLTDGEEVNGWTITVDGQERQVSSNPLLVDSSGDGMTDFEAKHGEIEIDGELVEFPPVDPMLPDTDGDGLPDYEEIRQTFGPDDERLNPTLSDTAGSGLLDGEELEYWQSREAEAEEAWPENLEPPTHGDCLEQATAAIEAQDPAALGPGGDLSGDCIPNVLDPMSAHNTNDPRLPPGTEPLLDGDQINPPERLGRTLPETDPALRSTSGDLLLDAWEIRWARYGADVDGQPTWVPDPRTTDSYGDGIPDEEDSWPGKENVPGTPSCWDQVAYEGDEDREATGAGVPWLDETFTNKDEMDRGTHPIGSRACDTDQDGLRDGWEAAYTGHPSIDPLEPLQDPWAGATVATACYPGSTASPSLPDPDELSNLKQVDVDVPSAGPVTATLDDELLPAQPRSSEPEAWYVSGTGCEWVDGEAQRGDQCQECHVVGMVVTLETQQWYKTNPLTSDSSGDGAPDAWKILWNAIGEGRQKDFVTPFANEADPVGDGLSMSETHELGASPIVEATLGCNLRDGDADHPLVCGEGGVVLQDAIGDHLLDDTCDEGDPAGTYQAQDAEEAQRLRDMEIVEVDDETFLCQPRLDPNAENTDVNGNGLPDALELLHAYREAPNDRPALLDARADESGNGLSTSSELTLGEPADWPEGTVWWFGSHPFSNTGYDADGDGLMEALFFDPNPFENLPEDPTPQNAWDLACEVGIVCHQSEDPFDWASMSASTNLEVTLSDVGRERGGDRVVDKDGTNLPAHVDVTDAGDPASDVPVALMALSPEEASDLEGGDKSVLGQPPKVICIQRTDADGSLDTEDCRVASNTTSADLEGLDRTWLGSSSPTWERDLSVLDPTVSHEQEGTPENQDRIVAWAMGTGEDPGATDAQPVLADASTTVELVELDDTATSGTEIAITVRVTDDAGDPLNAGELTLTLADHTQTKTVDGAERVTFQDVPLPTVDDAQDVTIDASYQHSPATFVSSSSDEATLRVLPTPELSVTPPSKAIAGAPATVEVTVHDEGTPVQGPLNVSLGDVQANASTDEDGSASVQLAIPEDVRPGTGTLEVRFEGTGDYGVATATQDVPVKQRFNASITPEAAALGGEQSFSIRLVDLADVAPVLDVNVTVRLAQQTATTTLSQGSEIATVSLPVETAVGQAPLNVTASTDEDRRYEPLGTTVPLEVVSSATVDFTTDRKPPGTVPRGEEATVIADVTDAIDRSVPEGTLEVSWRFGNETVPVENGRAEIPFTTPTDADPEPLTLTWELEGPGLEDEQGTGQIGLLVDTELDAEASLDASTSTVNVDLRLLDDRRDPLAGETVRVNWPLGDPVEAQTDTEGRTSATLVIPEDASAGDYPITAQYAGTSTFADSDDNLTVPVRAATVVDAPSPVVWNEGETLTFSGTVTSADEGTSVPVPVEVRYADRVVASSSTGKSFSFSLDAQTVEEMAGASNQFSLTVATPGDDRWAPSEASVLVERRIPVELSTGVNRTEDGATVEIQAHTPHGPLAGAQLGVGGEDTSPMTVTTDEDGRATVHLSNATGTLVVTYGGDGEHSSSQARVNMAQPAAPTAADAAWLVFVALAALVAVDVWILYRVVQRVRVGRQVEEVLSELEERLVLGDEVQASIYHAYLQLKAAAEVLGHPEEETETVREFGQRFASGLELDERPVKGLIRIFEQAWYGEVDPSMRTEAIEELGELQDHLRERGLVG